MSRMFFGFGHGFGGTHLLADMLDIVPGVDCKHERICPESPHAMFTHYLDVYRGEADPEQVVRAERAPLVRRVLSNGHVFGEVNGQLGFYAAALHKVWPDAKFIYMTRDPRGQIRTSFNTGIFDYDNPIFKGRDLWWWPSPREDDPYVDRWEGMGTLERCAWMWRFVNEFFMEQLESIPESHVFRYRFEEMTQGRRVNELCDFLGIDRADPAAIARITAKKRAKTAVRSRTPLPPWSDMDGETREKIAGIASETSVKLGYGDLNA